MAKSKIDWTEEVWNPITGCTKYSSGCKNCYAERMAHRLKAMGCKRYENEFEVTVHRDLLKKPLDWQRPRTVFVNSMSDLFHENVSDSDILEIFNVMNQAKQHTFQVLTKRSKRLLSLTDRINWTPNIWMGVSVEDADAIYRCEDLKRTDAMVKFISAEPLIGSINDIDLNGIDWIIVGGESGFNCRPMDPEWVYEIQRKAKISNVPFFFKQWGGVHKTEKSKLLNGQTVHEYPIFLKKNKRGDIN